MLYTNHYQIILTKKIGKTVINQNCVTDCMMEKNLIKVYLISAFVSAEGEQSNTTSNKASHFL